MKKWTDFVKKHILCDAKARGLSAVVLILIVAAVLMLFIGGNRTGTNEINIVKDGYSYTLSLTDDELGTVEEALEACEIDVSEGDTINCKLSDNAADVDIIVVNSEVETDGTTEKADTLIVFEETLPDEDENPEANGEEINENSEENTADEIPAEETEEDVPTDVPVVTIDYKDVDVVIPYETVYKYDTSMKKGDVRIENGQNGVKTNVYELTFVDGVEETRELVATKIKKAAVPKIVYEGTISTDVSSMGDSYEYTKVMNCVATAYTNSEKWGDHIAFSYLCGGGLRTRWGIIAVDPEVIPAGTKLYVKGLNGVKDYGYAIAADTGGVIKGNKIDLWMDNDPLCDEWGVKNVEVYFLKDQSVDIFALRGDYEWTK